MSEVQRAEIASSFLAAVRGKKYDVGEDFIRFKAWPEEFVRMVAGGLKEILR